MDCVRQCENERTKIHNRGPAVQVHFNENADIHLVEQLPPNGPSEHYDEYRVGNVSTTKQNEFDDGQEVDCKTTSAPSPTPSAQNAVRDGDRGQHSNGNGSIVLELGV